MAEESPSLRSCNLVVDREDLCSHAGCREGLEILSSPLLQGITESFINEEFYDRGGEC